VCCNVLQTLSRTTHDHVLECVGVCWSVLECVGVCCSVLQTLSRNHDTPPTPLPHTHLILNPQHKGGDLMLNFEIGRSYGGDPKRSCCSVVIFHGVLQCVQCVAVCIGGSDAQF